MPYQNLQPSSEDYAFRNKTENKSRQYLAMCLINCNQISQHIIQTVSWVVKLERSLWRSQKVGRGETKTEIFTRRLSLLEGRWIQTEKVEGGVILQQNYYYTCFIGEGDKLIGIWYLTKLMILCYEVSVDDNGYQLQCSHTVIIITINTRDSHLPVRGPCE